MNNTVNNLQDLLSQRKFGEETFAQLERNTYKYTTCGAWIHESDWGVALGSIVEGVDEGTQTYTLNYPFTIEEFWEALQAVEDEAAEIWKATHGCEDCHDEPHASPLHRGRTWRSYRAWPINPDCKTCEGEGVII
ncbi:MAG: hypothetical protein CL438_06845 [Acidimicrobiaceae bacterium]|nr:hypothetical protein [Acidimicrobiaceae bacterium]|tara:strand:- start:97 stop:501 length:405 start_codon:yes stop_codon:yes gene_type:complete